MNLSNPVVGPSCYTEHSQLARSLAGWRNSFSAVFSSTRSEIYCLLVSSSWEEEEEKEEDALSFWDMSRRGVEVRPDAEREKERVPAVCY